MIRVFLVFILATVILAHSKNQKTAPKKLIHREEIEAGSHYRILVPDVPIYIQKGPQVLDQSTKNNAKNIRNKRKKMGNSKYMTRKTSGRKNLLLFDHQKVQKLKDSSREVKNNKRFQKTNQNSLSQKELYGYLERLGYTVDESPFLTYSSEIPISNENHNGRFQVNSQTKSSFKVAPKIVPEVESQEITNSGQSYEVFEQNSEDETTFSREIVPSKPKDIQKAKGSSKLSTNIFPEHKSIEPDNLYKNYEVYEPEKSLVSQEVKDPSKSGLSQTILSQDFVNPVKIENFLLSKEPKALNQKVIPQMDFSEVSQSESLLPVAKVLDLKQLLNDPSLVLNTQELKKFTEDSSKTFLETTFVTFGSLENDQMSPENNNDTKNSLSENLEKNIVKSSPDNKPSVYSQPDSTSSMSSKANVGISNALGEDSSTKSVKNHAINGKKINQEQTQKHLELPRLRDDKKIEGKLGPFNNSFDSMEIIGNLGELEPPKLSFRESSSSSGTEKEPKNHLEPIKDKKNCTKVHFSDSIKESTDLLDSLKHHSIVENLSSLDQNLETMVQNLGSKEHNSDLTERNSSSLGQSFGSMEHNLSYQEIQMSSNELQISPVELRNVNFVISSDNLKEINQLQSPGTAIKLDTKKTNGPVSTTETPILEKYVELDPEPKGPNVYEHVFVHLLGPGVQNINYEKNIPIEVVIHK